MSFQIDPAMPTRVGNMYGHYLTTYTSEHDQVRAHLFEAGGIVSARVLFPGGLDTVKVTDKYDEELLNYAQQQGYGERFRLVYHV